MEIFLLTAWSLIIAIVLLLYTDKLHKKFPIPMVRHFLIYLTAFYLGGFLIMWSAKISLVIFKENFDLLITIDNYFFIIGLPLLGLMLFLFTKFILALLHEELTTSFIFIYWILWGALTLFFVLGAWVFDSHAPYTFFGHHLPYACGWAYKVGLYLTLGYLFVRALRMPDPIIRRQTLIFGTLFLLPMAVHHFNNFIIRNITLTVMFFFAVPLPATLYFKRYLTIVIGENPDIDSFQLAQTLARFDISKREEEIVRLILAGKSNRDIEKELYISPHTVKNHVYHIYKKLGINSRFHLIHMIRNGLNS
jgi:DNA-binding CsgD family transcriptional regulator